MDRAKRNAGLAIPAALLAGAALAWAGSSGGLRAGGMPVFASALVLAFAIQWVAFIPAYIYRTERFYDLTGSVTYVSAVVFSVALAGRYDARALLLTGMVAVWAIRLGAFLFRRVHQTGKDDRFTEIKQSFARFLAAWTLQGLWVSFTLAAALAAITASRGQPLGPAAWPGLGIWLIGFGIEIAADRQKRRFRAAPANKGRFIQSGLWAWSRHPNYFGEIVLWIGVAIVAVPVLRGWQWTALISPAFVTLLLTRISGVPILERRADERWGGQTEYEAYKKRTPGLILRPPGRQGPP